jgi:anti-anti-sigma factor
MVNTVPEADCKVMFLKDTPVMQLPVRLSVLEAVAFKETCQQILQKSSIPEQIIFDCSQTTFIDSCGIGALVSSHKSAREKGVELVLRGVPPQVMAVLQMTALDQILTLEPLDEPKPQAPPPTTHPSVRSWVKRLLDILGGLVGLAITAIAFIPIAIAIKLDSPGPSSSFKPAVVGWASGFGFGNSARCVLMQKSKKTVSKIKQTVRSSRMKTTPE